MTSITLPVSQEARNHAADHQDHARGYSCSAPLRDGRADDCSIVQAFAKFEQLIRSKVIDEAAGEQWQPIETARYGETVEVKVGSMTLLAKLLHNHSENEHGSCDQWVAAIEGEHPPCWSDGCCWDSNEDEITSLQPTAWRPASIRQLGERGR